MKYLMTFWQCAIGSGVQEKRAKEVVVVVVVCGGGEDAGGCV